MERARAHGSSAAVSPLLAAAQLHHHRGEATRARDARPSAADLPLPCNCSHPPSALQSRGVVYLIIQVQAVLRIVERKATRAHGALPLAADPPPLPPLPAAAAAAAAATFTADVCFARLSRSAFTSRIRRRTRACASKMFALGPWNSTRRSVSVPGTKMPLWEIDILHADFYMMQVSPTPPAPTSCPLWMMMMMMNITCL